MRDYSSGRVRRSPHAFYVRWRARVSCLLSRSAVLSASMSAEIRTWCSITLIVSRIPFRCWRGLANAAASYLWVSASGTRAVSAVCVLASQGRGHELAQTESVVSHPMKRPGAPVCRTAGVWDAARRRRFSPWRERRGCLARAARGMVGRASTARLEGPFRTSKAAGYSAGSEVSAADGAAPRPIRDWVLVKEQGSAVGRIGDHGPPIQGRTGRGPEEGVRS